jgi:EmrB/QacA subfamily drug resistance transporter
MNNKQTTQTNEDNLTSQSEYTYKPFNQNIPTLLVLCLALVISVIDGTVLNVSINDITRDLGSNLKGIQWVITCYSLVIAALTIFGGRLGDLYGAKKMFILGAIIFGAGSALTAFAGDINMLLGGWSIVEGIGAALMIPASSSLIIANFAPQDRGKAFGIYGASAGMGSAIGPILGGFLTTNFSWRWAFGINVFVVLVLVLASVIVKESEIIKDKNRVKLDFLGVALSSVGLSAISYGIIESSDFGWWRTTKSYELFGQSLYLGGFSITPIMLAIGLIAMTTFVWYEHKLTKAKAQPLIDLNIFRNRQFTIGILASGVLFSAFVGIITFGIALFYQRVLNLSAFDSGVGLIPLSFALVVIAPLSSRIAKRITAKKTVLTGLAIATLACVSLYFTLSLSADRISFIFPLALFGLGFGLLVSQLSSLTLESIDRQEAGVASGINGTVREVGRTFGTAIIGAAFLSAFMPSLISNINNSQLPVAAKTQILQQINTEESSKNTQNNPCQLVPNQSSAATAFNQQICIAQNQSYVESSKVAILYTGIFVLACFLIALNFENKERIIA